MEQSSFFHELRWFISLPSPGFREVLVSLKAFPVGKFIFGIALEAEEGWDQSGGLGTERTRFFLMSPQIPSKKSALLDLCQFPQGRKKVMQTVPIWILYKLLLFFVFFF